MSTYIVYIPQLTARQFTVEADSPQAALAEALRADGDGEDYEACDEETYVNKQNPVVVYADDLRTEVARFDKLPD